MEVYPIVPPEPIPVIDEEDQEGINEEDELDD